MTSKINLKGRDNSGELTTFSLYFPDTTAGNFAGQSAALDAIQAAVNDVTLSQFNGKQLLAVDVPVAGQAADTGAQREGKWRVTYTDTVSPIGDGSFEIGMYDPALIDSGTQNMIAGAERTALVGAIEANCVSRLGNPIVVDKITHVGRNT